MDNRELTDIYRDLLPECACFAPVNGELDQHSLDLLGLCVNIGEQVAGHLMSGNVCPKAAPALLTLVLSAASINMSMGLRREIPAETALDLMPEFRSTLETVAGLVPTEVRRAYAAALETSGVAGSC